jgi:hypothetical protein
MGVKAVGCHGLSRASLLVLVVVVLCDNVRFVCYPCVRSSLTLWVRWVRLAQLWLWLWLWLWQLQLRLCW